MPLTKKHHFTRNSRLETSREIKFGGALFPTRDEIARLAYAYWEERGKPLGSAEADWVRAEGELRSRREAGPLPGETARPLRVALRELDTNRPPVSQPSIPLHQNRDRHGTSGA